MRDQAGECLFTDERDAIMRRLYPAGEPAIEIIEHLNKLPGRVAETGDLQYWARRLKVRRPPRQSIDPWSTAPLRSAARDAVMREEYPAGTSAEHIVTLLNELSGPVVKRYNLARWAQQLKLLRPTRWAERERIMVTVRSAERDALMRELYVTMLSAQEITDRLNALAGKHIRRQQIADYASALGVTRSAAYRAALGNARVAKMAEILPGMIEAVELDEQSILAWGRRNGAGRDPGTINALRKSCGLPMFIVRKRAA